jgi:hypothetical protein
MLKLKVHPNSKLIVTFYSYYNQGQIETVAYKHSIQPHQIIGKVLYHECNFPLKIDINTYFDKIYKKLTCNKKDSEYTI